MKQTELATSWVGCLINRHVGETVTIFGTGPSLDDFDVSTLTGPRIFLNRTAFVLPASPGETYWLVADDAWAQGLPGPWRAFLDGVMDGSANTIGVFRDPLMNGKTPTHPPAGPNILHWSTTAKNRDELLSISREELAERNELYQFCGTASPAIHLAWLMGASKVRLVGIDGTDGWADLVIQFYDKPKRGGFGYLGSFQDANKAASVLGIEVEDLSRKGNT